MKNVVILDKVKEISRDFLLRSNFDKSLIGLIAASKISLFFRIHQKECGSKNINAIDDIILNLFYDIDSLKAELIANKIKIVDNFLDKNPQNGAPNSAYSENSLLFLYNLLHYLASSDSKHLEWSIVNYFDIYDYLAQEVAGVDNNSKDVDFIVWNSVVFQSAYKYILNLVFNYNLDIKFAEKEIILNLRSTETP